MAFDVSDSAPASGHAPDLLGLTPELVAALRDSLAGGQLGWEHVWDKTDDEGPVTAGKSARGSIWTGRSTWSDWRPSVSATACFRW